MDTISAWLRRAPPWETGPPRGGEAFGGGESRKRKADNTTPDVGVPISNKVMREVAPSRTHGNESVAVAKEPSEAEKALGKLAKQNERKLRRKGWRLFVEEIRGQSNIPHQGRQIRGFKIFLWDSTNNICLYCRLFKKTIFIVIIFLIRCPFRH